MPNQKYRWGIFVSLGFRKCAYFRKALALYFLVFFFGGGSWNVVLAAAAAGPAEPSAKAVVPSAKTNSEEYIPPVDQKKSDKAREELKRGWHNELPTGSATFGLHFSEDLVDGFGDFMVPFWQPHDNGILMMDYRGTGADSDQAIGSVGLVYRAYLPEQNVILGVNSFYDFIHTPSENSFSQWGVGVELLSKWFDARFNYYLPETKTALVPGSSVAGVLGAPIGVGHQVVAGVSSAGTGIFESPLQGFYVEGGFLVPWVEKYADLKLFGGYYDYNSRVSADIAGFKGRAELKVSDAITFDVEYYDDEALMGGNWTGGVRVTVPFEPQNLAQGRNPFEGITDMFTKRSRDVPSRATEMVIRSARVKTATGIKQTSSGGPAAGTVLADNIVVVQPGAVGGNGTFESPIGSVSDLATGVADIGAGTGANITMYTRGGADGGTVAINPVDYNLSLVSTANGIPLNIIGGVFNDGAGRPVFTSAGTVFDLTSTGGTFSISGYDFSGAGTALQLTGFGTVTVNDVGFADGASRSLNVINTGAVNVTNVAALRRVRFENVGGLTLTNTALNVTGGPIGVEFVNTAGTFNLGAGTVTGTTGAGLQINNTGGQALTVSNLEISNVTGDGVFVTGSNGTTTLTGVNVTNAGGAGFRVDGGDGTVTSNGTVTTNIGTAVAVTNRAGGAVTLSGSILATDLAAGVAVSGATADNTLTFTGAVTLGTTGNPLTGGPGVNIDFNGQGTGAAVIFDNTLSVVTNGQTGIAASNGGLLRIDAGTVETSGVGATAIDLNGITSNITLASVTADNIGGAATGLEFDSVAGTFTVIGATTLGATGAIGTGIDIAGGDATYNFGSVAVDNRSGSGILIDGTGGTLTFGQTTILNTGNSAASALVVQNTTGGTVTFSNAAHNIDQGTGGADAVALNNNAAVFAFNGGTITAQTGAGFAAVDITGAANGVTFTGTQISQTGAGLVLDIHDVTGGSNILFDATGGVTATGAGNEGINISDTVANVTIANATLANTGGTAAVRITDSTGQMVLNNASITAAAGDGVNVDNLNGTIRWNGGVIDGSGTTVNGIVVNGNGSQTIVEVLGSSSANTFSNLTNDAVQVTGTGPGGTVTLSDVNVFNIGGDAIQATDTGDVLVTEGLTLLTLAGGRFINETGVININDATLSNLVIDGGNATININGTTVLNGDNAGNLLEIINGAAGTLNFAGTTSITQLNAANTGILVDASSTAVTFAGPLTLDGEGGGITVQNGATSVLTFNGNVTLSTGANDAIDVSGSAATLDFNSGLAITTTTGTGINMTSGTLNTVGGTVAASAGAAVNLDVVTANATFTSLSSTGATAEGIRFNAVSGSVTVTGTTTVASSGGDAVRITDSPATFDFQGLTTIDNAGDEGIALSGATNGDITFGSIDIDGTSGRGIEIVGATNDVTVNGGTIGATAVTGGFTVRIDSQADGSVIAFNNVSTTAENGDNFNILNGSGTVTVTGGTHTQNGGNDVLDVESLNATGVVNFGGALVHTAGGQAVELDASAGTINVSGSVTATGGAQAFEIGDTAAITGGTITFSGAVSQTGGSASSISNVNAGAAVAFTNTVTITNPTTDALILNTNAGTVSFANLALTTNAGRGLVATNQTGLLTVTTGAIDATGGASLDLDTFLGNLNFTSLSSVNSTAEGLEIDGGLVGTTLTVSGATTVTNSASAGIDIANSLGTYTLGSVDIDTTGGHGISLNNVSAFVLNGGTIDGTTAAGVNSSNTVLTVSGITIGGTTAAGTAGIQIANTDGTTRIVTLNNNNIRSVGDGIVTTDGGTAAELVLNLNGNTIETTGAGSLAMRLTGSGADSTIVASMSGGTVIGNGVGGGLLFDRITFDASGAALSGTQVNAGTWNIGQGVGTRVEGDGASFINPTGDLSFTVLNIFNNNGIGLEVDTKGLGTTFNLATGGGAIDTTNGTALFLDPLSVNMTLASVTSTGSPGAGVVLDTVTGNLTIGTTTITNATGAGILAQNNTGALNANFGATTIDGAAVGIDLNDAGNYTFGTTSVSNVTGNGLDLNGTSGTIGFGAVTLNNVGGNGVDVNGTTGGGITIGSLTIDAVTGNGIDLTDNAATFAVTGLTSIGATTGVGGNAIDINGTSSGAISFGNIDITNLTNNTVAFDMNGADASVTANTLDIDGTGSTGVIAIDLRSTQNNRMVTITNGGTIQGVDVGVQIGSGVVGDFSETANVNFRYDSVGGNGSSITATIALEARGLVTTSGSTSGQYHFENTNLTGATQFEPSSITTLYFVSAVANGLGDGSSVANAGTIASADVVTGNNVIFVLLNDDGTINLGGTAFTLSDGQTLDSFGNGQTFNGSSTPANIYLAGGIVYTDANTGGFGAATLTTTASNDLIVVGDGNTIQNFTLTGAGGTTLEGTGFNSLQVLGMNIGGTGDVFNFANAAGNITMTNNTVNTSGGNLLTMSGGNAIVQLTAGTGSIANSGGGFNISGTTGGNVTVNGAAITGATSAPLVFDNNDAVITFTNSSFATNAGVTLLNVDTGAGGSTAAITFNNTNTFTHTSGTIATIGAGARNIDLSAHAFTNTGSTAPAIIVAGQTGGTIGFGNITSANSTAANVINSTGQTGGTLSFGNVAITGYNNAGGTAVNLQGSAAGFATFGDLDITTTAGSGLNVGNIAFNPGASSEINATGGSAVTMNGTTVTNSFVNLTSTNAGGDGISLTSVGGIFGVTGTATVANAGTRGIGIFNSTAAITINAVDIDSSASAGIRLSGNSGLVQILGGTIDGGVDGVSVSNTSATLSNVNIGGTTSVIGRGVDVVGNAGSNTVTLTNNTIRSNSIGIATADGGAANNLILALDGNSIQTMGGGSLAMNITGSAGGSTVVRSFNGVTVTGNGTGGGVLFDTVTFDASAAGGIQSVTGGTAQIGTAGNRVAGDGLVLTDTAGSLGFTALNIFNNNGTGLNVDTTGAGTSFVLNTGSGGTVNTTNGRAVFIDTAVLTGALGSAVSTNSGSTGVALDSVDGAWTVNSIDVSNAATAGFLIQNNGTVHNFGAISVNGAATGIQIVSNISTVNVTGLTTLQNITGTAIDLTTAGGSVNFDDVSINTAATGIGMDGATGTYVFGDIDIAAVSGVGLDLEDSNVVFTADSFDMSGSATATAIDLTRAANPNGANSGTTNINIVNGGSISGVRRGVDLSNTNLAADSSGASFHFGGGSIAATVYTIDAIGLVSTNATTQGNYDFANTTFTGDFGFRYSAGDLLFVGSSATGAADGSSLSDLAAVGTADANTSASTIFVLVNDGTSINVGGTAFTLSDSQQIDGFGNGNTFDLAKPINITGANIPGTFALSHAGGAATITGTNTIVQIGNGNSIQNVAFSGGATSISGTGATGFQITDTVLSGGSTSMFSFTNVAGTFNITNNTISQTGGRLLELNGGTAAFTLSAGTGSVVNNDGNGIRVRNTTGGSVTLDNLQITSADTNPLIFDNNDATITFTNNTVSVDAGITLLSVDAVTGGSTSNLVFGNTNTFTQTSGAIANIGAGARNVDLSAHNFTNTGSTSATVINSVGQTGGTISFGNVTITGYNNGAGTAVNLQGSAGTATFGDLDITTTAGSGLNVGAITFNPGSSTTINTTGGTALTMNGTTLSGGSATFTSVQSSTPAVNTDGISVSNVTGTLNITSATVSGASGASGDGIRLTGSTVNFGTVNVTNFGGAGINLNASTGTYNFGNVTINFTGAGRAIDLRDSNVQMETDNLAITGNGAANSIAIDLSGSLNPNGANSATSNIRLAQGTGGSEESAVITNVQTGIMLGDATEGSAGAYLVYGNQTAEALNDSVIDVAVGGFTLNATNLTSTNPFTQGRYEFLGVDFSGDFASFQTSSNLIFVSAVADGLGDGTSKANAMNGASLAALTAAQLDNRVVVLVNDNGAISIGADTLLLGANTRLTSFGNGNTVSAFVVPVNIITDTLPGANVSDSNGAGTLTATAGNNVVQVGTGAHSIDNVGISGGNFNIFLNNAANLTVDGATLTGGASGVLSYNGATGTTVVQNSTLTNTGGSLLSIANNTTTANITIQNTVNISQTGGNLVNINGGNATVSFSHGGTYTNSGGINVLNTAGGTYTFNNLDVTGFNNAGQSAFAMSGNAAGTTVNVSDLDVTTTAGNALVAVGPGVLNFTDATSSLSAGNGIGLSLSGGINVGSATFTSVSASGTGAGIDLNGATSTGITINGGAISGMSAEGLRVNGGAYGVTYAGTISNVTGRVVDVTSRTGGTVTVSGAVSDTDGGNGVRFDSNTGASTLTFSSGVTLGTSGTRSSTGVVMTANAAGTDLNFNSGLTTFVTGASALLATGAGSLDVAGGGEVNQTGAGSAIEISGVNGSMSLTAVRKVAGTGAGVTITTSTGTKSFGDLDVTTTNGDGVVASNAGTLQSTSGTISAIGVGAGTGAALDISGTTVLGMVLDSMASDNSLDNGLRLNGTTGTLTSASNTFTDAASHGISLTGTSATVTLNSTLISGNAGNAVNVSTGAANLTVNVNTGAGGAGIQTNAGTRILNVDGTTGGSVALNAGTGTITGEITNTSGGGIKINNSNGAVTVTNFVITTPTGIGVEIDGGSNAAVYTFEGNVTLTQGAAAANAAVDIFGTAATINWNLGQITAHDNNTARGGTRALNVNGNNVSGGVYNFNDLDIVAGDSIAANTISAGGIVVNVVNLNAATFNYGTINRTAQTQTGLISIWDPFSTDVASPTTGAITLTGNNGSTIHFASAVQVNDSSMPYSDDAGFPTTYTAANGQGAGLVIIDGTTTASNYRFQAREDTDTAAIGFSYFRMGNGSGIRIVGTSAAQKLHLDLNLNQINSFRAAGIGFELTNADTYAGGSEAGGGTARISQGNFYDGGTGFSATNVDGPIIFGGPGSPATPPSPALDP
jgi:hypothetical protein